MGLNSSGWLKLALEVLKLVVGALAGGGAATYFNTTF